MTDLMSENEQIWSLGPLGLRTLIWTLLAASFLIVWLTFKLTSKKYKLPPGPPTWPIIGNMTTLMDTTKPTHHIINELAKTYGPIFLLKLGAQNLVFVTDRDLTLEVMKENDHLFSFRPPQMPAIKYMSYQDKQVSLGPSGDYHSFFRKLAITELLAMKKLKDFQVLRKIEQDAVIRECFNSSQRNEAVDMHLHLNTMALNIISNLAFGKKSGVQSQSEWMHLIPMLTENFALLLAETCHPSLGWLDTLIGNRKRMVDSFKIVDNLLQELLNEHTKALDALSPKELAEYEPKDFMDIILLQRNGENSKFITETAVKAVSLDLIVGGSDTVVTALEWALSELLRHPNSMKKAHDELDSVIGKDRFVTEADAPNLPYVAAILKETFRLHPPVPWLLPHSNRSDCKIAGYDIPAWSYINVNVHGMGRSDALWKDPDRFDPDRFLDSSTQSVDVMGSYPQLMPFGRGRRMCPGAGFAHSIMNTVLPRLIHSFDWTLPDDQSTLDMSERHGVVAAKRTPLIAVPKPRLAAHLYESL